MKFFYKNWLLFQFFYHHKNKYIIYAYFRSFDLLIQAYRKNYNVVWVLFFARFPRVELARSDCSVYGGFLLDCETSHG